MSNGVIRSKYIYDQRSVRGLTNYAQGRRYYAHNLCARIIAYFRDTWPTRSHAGSAPTATHIAAVTQHWSTGRRRIPISHIAVDRAQ